MTLTGLPSYTVATPGGPTTYTRGEEIAAAHERYVPDAHREHFDGTGKAAVKKARGTAGSGTLSPAAKD